MSAFQPIAELQPDHLTATKYGFARHNSPAEAPDVSQ